MSYSFENQISAFCDDYILFCTFFCHGTFFVTVLWKFDKIKNFWLFFFGAKNERWTTNQHEISCMSWKNSNWSTKVASRSLWWWHDVKNSSFWLAQEVRRGKRGSGRWSQKLEAIHKQNRWKCWACETKGAINRRLTVRMIADELGMNSEWVWRIIMEDLGMIKICAKMVPRLLNEGQKERRVQMCQDILEQLETEPNLLKRVVTGDESWIFEYDPLTKRQSLEWKSSLSPRPKNARVFKSKTKEMLIAFFDVHGIVHARFLPQGQTINQHVYKTILRRLMHSVTEKRRELWEARSWLLHHDNALAHIALGIRKFLAKNNIAVLEQPPYSPDLAPCDFFLFPKLKEVIKGTRFQDSEAIKTAVKPLNSPGC